MNYQNVNADRLCKLADLLLSQKYKWYEYRLGPVCQQDSPSVSSWNSMPVLEVVISESINVFPDEWYWNTEYDFAYYAKDKLMNPCSSAMIFYELDFLMFKHLFVPYSQVPFYFGGKMLGLKIAPADIGNNIYEFVRNYKSIMN